MNQLPQGRNPLAPRRGARRSLVALAAVAAIATSAGRALAWGCAGHVIIARVAQERMSPPARRASADILGSESLQEASCWPDDIRPSRPETKRWHYVDIPRDRSDYVPSRDCRWTEEGDCLVAATERFARVLGDLSLPRARRREALRFLVHLVGDLHQPLHTDDHDDRGGNEVRLRFLDRPTNLHAMWDSAIIDEGLRTDWAWPGFPESVLRDAGALADKARGDVVAWALESHRVGEAIAYSTPPGGRVTARDAAALLPAVRRQLALAGVRLAAMLESALLGPLPARR